MYSLFFLSSPFRLNHNHVPRVHLKVERGASRLQSSFAVLAQLEERCTSNPQVHGSSP